MNENNSNKAIDWNNLSFQAITTKSIFLAKCNDGEKWDNGNLVPYGDLEIPPTAGVLNYGQGVFEGMKAYRTTRNKVVLFRPDMNQKRLKLSSQRLCIPEVDEELFFKAVKQTVIDNHEFIPPFGKGSLYIRPISLGTGATLGLRNAPSYTFMVYVSPVGNYFKGSKIPCISVEITHEFHRASSKGVGSAKTIGNYASSLYPLNLAKSKGFDEVMYLNAENESLIDELGSANIFIIKDNILKTPKLTGAILPGVTRDSVIKIAKEILKIKVEEKEISISDVLSADEVFCTGTAVVISPIGKITNNGTTTKITDEIGPTSLKLRKILTDIQLQKIEDLFGWIYPIEIN